MKCEFSERNYEKSLDFELSTTHQIFSPTQNQENTLAIDSATISDNSDFWQLWDPNWRTSPSIPRGIDITKDLWKWARGIPKIHFPKIRANVFLQYKIPEYFPSHAKEYSYWQHPYFRYYINSHQNRVLSKLENNTTQSAVVVYASPAFWTYDQLMDNCIQRTLVSHSNFVKPSTISGHHCYTYDASGINGQGFSKPEKIKTIDLKNEIDNLLEISQNLEFGITLKKLSSEIVKTVNEIDAKTNDLDEQFKVNFQKTREYFLQSSGKNTDESNHFLNVLSFVYLADLSWVVVI